MCELLFACYAHGQNMCGNTRHMVDERGRWHCVACGARWRTRFHIVMKVTIDDNTSCYKLNEKLKGVFLRGLRVDITVPEGIANPLLPGDLARGVRLVLDAAGDRLPDDVLSGNFVRHEHIGLFLLA